MKISPHTNRLLAFVKGLRKLGKIYSLGEVNKKILRSLPRKKFEVKITSINFKNHMYKVTDLFN